MLGGWIEWVGYVASLTIALSLMMNDMTKLRVVNSIGCIFFVLYGCLVGAYPVVVSNVIIAGINVYQLMQSRK